MINPAVFTTTFLAAAVEIIEMVIIVVGVGAIGERLVSSDGQLERRA